jgi:hypothetical protein
VPLRFRPRLFVTSAMFTSIIPALPDSSPRDSPGHESLSTAPVSVCLVPARTFQTRLGDELRQANQLSGNRRIEIVGRLREINHKNLEKTVNGPSERAVGRARRSHNPIELIDACQNVPRTEKRLRTKTKNCVRPRRNVVGSHEAEKTEERLGIAH